MKYIGMYAVFLFHRDLRLVDNTTLIQAVKDGYKVIPVFCFPPKQIDPQKNVVFSHPAVQFMCESLRDLDQSLRRFNAKLHMFHGDYEDVLDILLKTLPFQRVYSNRDESVFAHQRDGRIDTWCKKHDIAFIQNEDYGLVSLHDGLLPDGRPYSVLQQYYKRFDKDVHVRKVNKYSFTKNNFKNVATNSKKEIHAEQLKSLYQPVLGIKVKGGRSEGIKMLQRLRTFREYTHTRDYPAQEGTTRASAYLKFGCISIREMYWQIVKQFGKHHGLVRELVFRDFYFKIYALRPELQRTRAYHHEMDQRIPWTKDAKRWNAWTNGTTGFPMVDAGMRQLMQEGWMHNRVRMLVASVATRYLLLDWRKCAQFFYSRLVDADPFSNTAGWQWSAGIGVDSAPYFRAPFNPFRQSERFDKDAEYIKRWVPELAPVASRDIHRWGDPNVRAKYDKTIKYPSPIVDAKVASAESVRIWKSAAKH